MCIRDRYADGDGPHNGGADGDGGGSLAFEHWFRPFAPGDTVPPYAYS